ncbi:MAG: hypothetical protein QOJ16_2805, partial [Acidobacteriota bacterium]|nr:hypothetical protein [Acidobacteriota bacterium]
MKMRRLLPMLLLTALSTAPLAFGQTDTPVGDDPDPDALARVAKSDVVTAATGGQVLRSGDHFVQDGHVFLPKGVNFELHGHPWNLWTNYSGQTGEVEAELDRARRLGGNVIRVFLPANLPYPTPPTPPPTFGGIPQTYDVGTIGFNPSLLSQLDDFLNRADAHGLKVLLTLYDGVNTYRTVNWICRGQIGNPYARNEGTWDWQNTSPDSNGNTWLHGPDIRPFRIHADQILTGTIPGTNRVLANDPRVFGWDVMNEHDHLFHQVLASPCDGVYLKDFVNAWVGWMARHARIYTRAPITAGTYGWFLNPTNKERQTIQFDRTQMEYSTLGGARSLWDDLDFISIHWFQPVDQQNPNVFGTGISTTKSFLAGRFAGGKPVVVEEIGQADWGWSPPQQQQPGACQQQGLGSCGPNLSCNRTWVHDWTQQWAPIAKSLGAGSLIWTGSDFVFTANCNNENGHETNQDFFGFYDGNGALKPAGGIYTAANSDAACTRAAFRTRDGQHWLTAQNGGGSYLDASGSGANPPANAIFSFFHSGDGIGLKILKNKLWYYVTAAGGGGSYVTVDQTQFSWMGTFGLVYLGFVSGLGDDAVAFRTWNGPYYFSA